MLQCLVQLSTRPHSTLRYYDYLAQLLLVTYYYSVILLQIGSGMIFELDNRVTYNNGPNNLQLWSKVLCKSSLSAEPNSGKLSPNWTLGNSFLIFCDQVRYKIHLFSERNIFPLSSLFIHLQCFCKEK